MIHIWQDLPSLTLAFHFQTNLVDAFRAALVRRGDLSFTRRFAASTSSFIRTALYISLAHGTPDYGPHPPETDILPPSPHLQNTVSAAHRDQTHSCSHRLSRPPSCVISRQNSKGHTLNFSGIFTESLPVQFPCSCVDNLIHRIINSVKMTSGIRTVVWIAGQSPPKNSSFIFSCDGHRIRRYIPCSRRIRKCFFCHGLW